MNVKNTTSEQVTDQSSYFHIIGLLVLWGVLYICVHIVHFRYFVVDVVFYTAFSDVIFSAVVLGVLYFVFLRKRLRISRQNLVLSTLLGLSYGYIFAITVPTVIDRSLSAYILEKLVQRGGGVQTEALEDIFVHEYIPEFKLMDVRMQEALSSGTVVIENGCIQITAKGRRVASITQFYRHNFLPKKRMLMGTDDLIDPFKDTAKGTPKNANYKCSISSR